jgi:hypothetical protein
MNLTIKKLAKVTLNNAQNLPDSPGIYFACDAAYRVWYVGTSFSLREEFIPCLQESEFHLNNVQYISYLQWNDMEDLEEWEHEYIQRFNPPLNNNFVDPELPIIDLGYDKSQYLARYKEIKLIQKVLEQELEELKPNLVTLIEDNDGKIKTNDCSAWVSKRVTYQYSLQLEHDERIIKERKKQEESEGIATIKSVSIYPVVR